MQSNKKRILETIRRLYRRGNTTTLINLLNKTHPAILAWIFRYLTFNEKLSIFHHVKAMEGFSEFIYELDEPIIVEIFDRINLQSFDVIIDNLDEERIAYLLDILPEKIKFSINQALDKDEEKEIKEIRKYTDD